MCCHAKGGPRANFAGKTFCSLKAKEGQLYEGASADEEDGVGGVGWDVVNGWETDKRIGTDTGERFRVLKEKKER